MKNLLLLYTLLILMTICCCCSHAKTTSKFKTSFYKKDSAWSTQLRHNGIRVQRKNIIAWYPAHALPTAEMNQFADTLDNGVGAAKAYIGAFPWQRSKGRINYFFPADSFISHATLEGSVYIPLWRLRERKAPWLHEGVHELLASRSVNQNRLPDSIVDIKIAAWMIEGFADYISDKVSYDRKIAQFDLFKSGGLEKIDSLCARYLDQGISAYILSFIGKPGYMPELGGPERITYAPMFYNFSCSFIKFLIDTYGVEKIIGANEIFLQEHTKLEAETGQPVAELKKRWLAHLNEVKRSWAEGRIFPGPG